MSFAQQYPYLQDLIQRKSAIAIFGLRWERYKDLLLLVLGCVRIT